MPQPLLRQIKASAGSGKTYDLTRRFLMHISKSGAAVYAPSCDRNPGTGWGDILAVTFTNSAAAEMKQRVVRRLKEIALGIGAPDNDVSIPARRAAVWVNIILRQYSALNIRTIDSLLHLIVRTAALELGLPPDFEPAFSTEETLTPILDACMERAWQGDRHMQELLRAACRSLLHHTDIKGFTAGDRLARQIRPLLDNALLERLSETPRHLASLTQMEERHGRMTRAVVIAAADILKVVDEEQLPLQSRAKDAFSRCSQGDLGALKTVWLSKDCLDGCLLKAGQGKASARASRTYRLLCEAAKELDGPGRLLRRGLELAPFAALAAEVAAGLEAFQQAEGKIPGILLPDLARRVLGGRHGVPGALCRLGNRLTHLLIDEFQDTSLQQWQALRPLVEEALSRGGSLTWVGDMKQAIYGWRGGDVTLFDAVLRDGGLRAIAPSPPHADNLPTNWRSREEIVRFNNTVFQQLTDPKQATDILFAMLPQETPPQIVGEAVATLVHTFTEGAQVVPDRESSRGGLVSLASVEAEDSDTLSEAVRARLSAVLEGIADRRPWSDVTILVRSNAKASLVASWLMEQDIPVVTENSLLLAEHPLVIQTVAFLAFLDSPQDDLAFWTFATGSLFAGLCGLDAPTLYGWAARRRKGYLCMAFREAFPQIWQRWLAPFHGKAGLMSPYDTVREFHHHMRTVQRFPEAKTFLRRFLEVVYAAEEQGNATLGTFLEHWRRSGGEEKVPMPESMDAVRIMTIHKSKGLQFPVVVIPWMSFPTCADTPPVPVRVADMDILAPRCKEMGDVHYAALTETAREALNLLYVAWTRAVDELHIFHTTTPGLLRRRGLANALEILLPCAGYTLPCILGAPPGCDERGQTTTSDTITASEGTCRSEVPQEETFPEPASDADGEWRPMQWLPRLKIFRNPLEGFVFTGRRRGILAHHCLENLHLSGRAEEDARRAVLQGMRTFPLPIPDAEAVAADLIRALSWYAALPEARDWTERGIPEQTIVDAKGNLHRVDLLIGPTTDDPVYVAVEYKTGAAEDAHVAQVRRYLGLLTAMAPSVPAHAVIVYLDLQRCRTVTLSNIFPPLTSPLRPDTIDSAPE